MPLTVDESSTHSVLDCSKKWKFARLVVLRLATALGVALCVLTPKPALAQQSDQWEVTFVPFYFWATELNGSTTVRNTTIPIFLDFADAADSLGGAFSFHFEAGKGRFGLFSDIYFVQLSSNAEFVLPSRVVDGNFDLDNTIFELGGAYRVSAPFAIVGGLRTVLPLAEARIHVRRRAGRARRHEQDVGERVWRLHVSAEALGEMDVDQPCRHRSRRSRDDLERHAGFRVSLQTVGRSVFWLQGSRYRHRR